MCDKDTTAKVANSEYNQVAQARESHTVYELKQKREYLLRQIVIVQQAIDAVNLASNF
jgi:hypothetical protein